MPADIRIYVDQDIARAAIPEEVEEKWFILLSKNGIFSYPLEDGMKVLGNGIMVIPPSADIRDLKTEKNFKGYLISLPSSFIHDTVFHSDMNFYSYVRISPFIPLAAKDISIIEKYFTLINDVMEGNEGTDPTLELQYLCKALVSLCKSHFKYIPDTLLNNTRTKKISNDFIKLVIKNCMKERSLDFYAGQLGITSKYLSAVIQENTGKHASRWIDEHTINIAKKLLKETDLSVKDIAGQMSFRSPSDFCRYFKKHTDLTPNTFRNV